MENKHSKQDVKHEALWSNEQYMCMIKNIFKDQNLEKKKHAFQFV